MSEESAQKKSLLSRINWSTVQSTLLFALVSLLISCPIFIIFFPYLPVWKLGSFRFDHILLFLGIFTFIFYIVKQLRLLLYIILGAGLIVLTYTSISGKYNFTDLKNDYNIFISYLSTGKVKVEFLEGGRSNQNKEKLQKAIDYKNEKVISYSRKIATANFSDSYHLYPRKYVQAFSVFKEIREKWEYVHDPRFHEYYQKASITIDQVKDDGHYKGDCDDYSIFMAAMLKAIGCDVRLVTTQSFNETRQEMVGHIFPEVLVGPVEDFDKLDNLLRKHLFPRYLVYDKLSFVEEDGNIWLNFDYNDQYPGGKYQSPKRLQVIKVK